MEEAETQIRLTLQNEYLQGIPLETISKKITKIIENALKKIKIPNLRRSARASLFNFYKKQYLIIRRIPRDTLDILFFLTKYQQGDKRPSERQKRALTRQNITVSNGSIKSNANLHGVPLQKFSKDYFRDNVKPIYDRLVKDFPLDPNDVTGRNSLRNLAEMEVRYQGHLDQIAELKSQGHRLVIASVHSDCSERCAKWQGRVYSLDGTSGTTDDGRKFIPLEEATDVWYTTKAGKRYKNGLLGFNCRHYLVPYKSGFKFPKPNVQEERKQYAITTKQRELERNVRKYRTQAITLKKVDRSGYLEARRKAIEWNRIYIKYSQDNNRAYYPSRTEIL